MEAIMRKKAYGKLIQNPKDESMSWKSITNSFRYTPKSEEEISFE